MCCQKAEIRRLSSQIGPIAGGNATPKTAATGELHALRERTRRYIHLISSTRTSTAVRQRLAQPPRPNHDIDRPDRQELF